ncbi:MAG TPA: cytochrome C [Blastocatellia bacterium]|nr:cytochrome C [Blastocatellia bacterium]
MVKKEWIKVGTLAVILAVGVTVYQNAHAQEPKHPPAPGDGKNMVVQLCDGKTHIVVPGVRPDERMTRKQAQAVSNELMKLWMAKQDPAVAAAWAREAEAAQQAGKPAAQQGEKAAPKSGGASVPQMSEQPVEFSARDNAIWAREVAREVAYGDQIFHDDKLIDSENGVACAMCHPNAANTHPETYPKFQIQLKRVALLRDMINWCIENPCRGKKLAADDPKMRALEAYIMAQRKGVPMEYGKH